MSLFVSVKGINEAKKMLQALGSEVPQNMSNALEILGINMVQEMQAICPVDTGFLQSEIGYDVTDDELNVFSGAPYSGYVEYGTWKMEPQPFFTPVVDRAKAGQGSDITRKLQNLVSSLVSKFRSFF